MPDKNTMGAPTEGLGQTVTFAWDQSNPMQLTPNTVQQGRTGLVGSAAVQAAPLQVKAPPSLERSINSLMSVAGSVLQPRLEKAKEEAYIRGMHQAAVGKAITEIADEQPWYTKIYGDGDAVEGARAYTGVVKANQTLDSISAAMSELRQKSPAEFQTYVSKVVADVQTGDKSTDLYVLHQITKQLPSLSKAHAKENFAYGQEQAATAYSAAVQSGAAGLRAVLQRRANSIATDDDVALSTSSVVGLAVNRPGGMDQKAHANLLTNSLESLAQSGDLHTINVLKVDPRLQTIIGPDNMNALDIKLNKIKSKLRWDDLTNNPEVRAEYDRLMARARMLPQGDGPEQLGRDIDAFNQKQYLRTGMMPGEGSISAQERSAMVVGSATQVAQAQAALVKDRLAEAKKDAERRDKQADEEKKYAAVRYVVGGSGDIIGAKANGMDASDIAAAQLASIRTAKTPDERIGHLMRWNHIEGNVVASYESAVQSAVAAKSYDAMTAVFDEYKALRKVDQFRADKVYGKFASKLSELAMAEENREEMTGAFNRVFVEGRQRVAVSDTNKQADVKTFEKLTQDSWPVFLGGKPDLIPGQAARLSMILSKTTSELEPSSADRGTAAARAFNLKKDQDFEVLGGIVVDRSKRDAIPLAHWLTHNKGAGGEKAVYEGNQEVVFRDAIEAVLRGKDGGAGILPPSGLFSDSLKHLMVSTDRVGDMPVIYINAITSDNQVKQTAIRADQIHGLATKQRSKPGKVGSNQSMGLFN